MGNSAGDTFHQLDSPGAEAIDDALDVLRDLPHWRLAPPRWDIVAQIVESIATAFAARDVEALRDATADLELAAPVRITRIGATPVVPAPPPVRDRANHLVHSLEVATKSGTGRGAGGDGDQPPPR